MNLLQRKKHKSPRFIVLAPQEAFVPPTFRNRWKDSEIHEQVLADMQRMRGRIALSEGAVRASELDSEGRHRMTGDERCWHLIRMGADGQVIGCARILVHPKKTPFSALRLASSALARNPAWSKQLRWTVEADMAVARRNELKVVEPGGWVLDERLRGTSEAVSIALSAFAWSQLFGDCLAYVTATVKHGSNSMLRRIGGDSVYFGGDAIPQYYEPAHQCEMEVLKLQTKALNPKFDAMLAPLRRSLTSAMVIQPECEAATLGQQWAAA